MTQENKESAQNTAATYKFDGDFLFGRHRVLPRCVEEANKSGKIVKQAVAWTVNTL